MEMEAISAKLLNIEQIGIIVIVLFVIDTSPKKSQTDNYNTKCETKHNHSTKTMQLGVNLTRLKQIVITLKSSCII